MLSYRLKLPFKSIIILICSFSFSCAQKSNDNDFLLQFLLFQTFLQNQSTPPNNTCGNIQDPLFSNQWHLENTGQRGGVVGEDARIKSLWNSNLCGAGISISVIDDGLDIRHEDLSANHESGKSVDYTTSGGTDPSGSNASHGTSVAGIIAARSNSIGLRGVAPLSNIRGFNLLQNQTNANESDAMTRDARAIFVSNNSWGPADSRGRLIDSNSLWRSAIDTGLTTGRNGLGTLYFWAAGNGGQAETDNSNYDGYANYQGVMAICAVGQNGKRPSYSEQGANLLVCGQSEGTDNIAILTTDNTGNLGYNTSSITNDVTDINYTNKFNGTSAATPVVAGVAALVLEANPNLGWRDVREILARSARKNDPTDSDWTTNGAGLNINHKYGFGAVDGEKAVERARSWTKLPSQKTFTTTTGTPNAAIPDNNATGVSNIINVSGSGITNSEFVELTVQFTHGYYRDLEIELTSPRGTKSILMNTGVCRASNGSVEGCGTAPVWRFGIIRVLGENPDGNWTLTFRDRAAADTGTFQSWNMKIFGR